MQTFAAHFSAISGCIKVPCLGDPESHEKLPFGGLGLAAVAVSPIILLWTSDHLVKNRSKGP